MDFQVTGFHRIQYDEHTTSDHSNLVAEAITRDKNMSISQSLVMKFQTVIM